MLTAPLLVTQSYNLSPIPLSSSPLSRWGPPGYLSTLAIKSTRLGKPLSLSQTRQPTPPSPGHIPQTGNSFWDSIHSFRTHMKTKLQILTQVWGDLGPGCVCSLVSGSVSERPKGPEQLTILVFQEEQQTQLTWTLVKISKTTFSAESQCLGTI